MNNNLPMAGKFQNPVYPFACPDPLVLKYLGEYWCYSTGFAADGNVFPILHSHDLVHWQPVASAMPPISGDHSNYWAPEVSYINGTFYLYYAVGDGTKMHLRVATAAAPQGPFTDSGQRLTRQEFAIDAHVFGDEDGRRYMFYATDFLDVPRIGTGTVVDMMIDPYTLSGDPRPVTLAKYDWQIFDPSRTEKGGVRWHTIEGSFVLKHHGRYYQMFSGGNWQNASYGVAYATADRIDQEHEWLQAGSGNNGEGNLPILRSDPAHGIIGPGHNSVVRGPDNRELFIVYHRWLEAVDNRVMAIDRMGWEDERLVVYGPTSMPQPVPRLPAEAGYQEFELQGSGMELSPENRLWMQARNETLAARHKLPHRFIVELYLRSPRMDSGGRIAIALISGDGSTSTLAFNNDENGVLKASHSNSDGFDVTEPFDISAFHLMRIEADSHQITWWLDEIKVTTTLRSQPLPISIEIKCSNADTEWAAFTLTIND